MKQLAEAPITPADLVSEFSVIDELLTADAIAFIEELHEKFGEERQQLLKARKELHQRFASGELTEFSAEVKELAKQDWQVEKVPINLRKRKVELLGPANAETIVKGLNSGADVFVADLEDSLSPTRENILRGHKALSEAATGCVSYYNANRNKVEYLESKTATLFVRLRALHAEETMLQLNSAAISASLFDFGLYFCHNAIKLIKKQSAPYFYLPKIETQQEADWWSRVFDFALARLNIPQGFLKASVVIETLPAVFQLDQIIYALRNYCVSVNVGRYDYLGSIIKTLGLQIEKPLPHRNQLSLKNDFIRAYNRYLIQVCHKRGVYAIGGMAAYITQKRDELADKASLEKIRVDKDLEAADGFDGTWVAHPDLISLARDAFNNYIVDENYLNTGTEAVDITAADLLNFTQGTPTIADAASSYKVALTYISSWLQGKGCIALNNLIEDAATAELARLQVWQWLHHPKSSLATAPAEKVLTQVKQAAGITAANKNSGAATTTATDLLDQLILEPSPTNYFTSVAAPYLNQQHLNQ